MFVLVHRLLVLLCPVGVGMAVVFLYREGFLCLSFHRRDCALVYCDVSVGRDLLDTQEEIAVQTHRVWVACWVDGPSDG